MNSHPNLVDVLEALGEKVQCALGRVVAHTRQDLAEYRALRPDWVAGHGESGLAHWIQDRLWNHLTVEMDTLDGVEIRERGVTREVIIAGTYRLRIKRHHMDGMVSTYPTQTALDFLEQPRGQLPGMEMVHLIAGYEWDAVERTITRPVLSLRDGDHNVIWLVALPEDELGAPVVVDLPSHGTPAAPLIELRGGLGTEDEAIDRG